MKRIIGGKSYNTATAQHVAQAEEREGTEAQDVELATAYNLYRTKGGAFFLVISEWRIVDGQDDDAAIFSEFYPLDYDQAHRFARGEPVQIGRMYLPGKQIARLAPGVFPTVEEAADDTPQAPRPRPVPAN
jgi:hypothetical protein